MAKLSNDPLARYRVDVYGEPREESAAAFVALVSTRDDLALVQMAVSDLSQDTTDEKHARILSAAACILQTAVDTISAAENVLEG